VLRVLVAVFLIVLVIEGAIRKWILPEYSVEVFVVKDVVIVLTLAAYAGMAQRNVPRSLDAFAWLIWVLLVLGYAVAAGFSFQSLVGLRYYLAPLPLILIMPALIRNITDLERTAAWAVRLSIPIGVLGIVQYLSPVDDPLNIYAWSGEQKSATFGLTLEEVFSGHWRPRVTATFSYISTYASFLAIAWLLAWLSLLYGRRRSDRAIAGAGLVLIAFNMAMNGSRGLLIVAAVSAVPFAISLTRRLGLFKTQLLAVLGMLMVGYAGISIFEPFALTAFRADAEEATGRITGQALLPFATLAEVDFAGTGIGTTFGGYEQLGHGANTGFDEVNIDRIGIEMGVPGYLYLLFIKILMVVKAFRVYRRARSIVLRDWALAALLVQLGSVWHIPFYNAVAATVYFCAIGLIYWIEAEERRLRALLRTAQPERQRPQLALAAWR